MQITVDKVKDTLLQLPPVSSMILGLEVLNLC